MEVEMQWAGVDYARVWLEPWEARAAGGAQGVWNKALMAGGLREEAVRPFAWRVAGLEGWLVQGVGVAENVEGNVLVQVAGAGAGTLLNSLHGLGRTSRIDLQVTVIPPVSRETAIWSEIEAMLEREANWPFRGRAPKVWYIVSDAITGYSGKRSKDGAQLRTYDSEKKHGEESEAYKGTIRYEVEANGKRAIKAYDMIGGDKWSRERVAEAVQGEATRRGCRMRLNGVEGRRVEPAARLTERSHEKSLEWIRKQVRPTIKRLIEENVSRKNVLEALGLVPTAQDAEQGE